MNTTTIAAPSTGAKRSAITAAIGKIARAAFSTKVSTIVLVAACVAVWWHIATAGSTLAAQRAVAVDALCALPWLTALLINSTKEGGKL